MARVQIGALILLNLLFLAAAARKNAKDDFNTRSQQAEKLKGLLNKPSHTNTIGESWELSGVLGDVSVVSNGKLSGKSLNVHYVLHV